MFTAENDTDRRQSERFPLMLDGEISIGATPHTCVIYDISADGAKIQVKGAEQGTEGAQLDDVVLSISRFGKFGGEIAWTDDNFMAIRFHENHKTMVSLILEDASPTH